MARDDRRRDLDTFQARLLDDLMPHARHRATTERAHMPTSVRRRPRRRLALAAAAVLIAGAGMAASVVTAWPEADQAAAVGIGCAETVSPSTNLTIVEADGRSPVAICAGLWRDGAITTHSIGKVPPLMACLTESGAVMVYPTETPGVCARFDSTADLPADYEQVAARMRRFRRALDARLSAGGTCRTLPQGATIAREELQHAGITGWTVSISSGALNGCAYFALDAPNRSVVIV